MNAGSVQVSVNFADPKILLHINLFTVYLLYYYYSYCCYYYYYSYYYWSYYTVIHLKTFLYLSFYSIFYFVNITEKWDEKGDNCKELSFFFFKWNKQQLRKMKWNFKWKYSEEEEENSREREGRKNREFYVIFSFIFFPQKKFNSISNLFLFL